MCRHFLRAQNGEIKQWVLQGRECSIYSLGASESPGKLYLSFVFLHALLPFSSLSFLHFWKCSPFWQPYEECDFYFNCWASVWDWDLLCACNGKKLAGRLPPPSHSSPLSLAGQEVCEGCRLAAAWLCFLLWSLQTRALCLCVREWGEKESLG